MRIISKFQDYYDSALAWGQDELAMHKRETLSYKESKGAVSIGVDGVVEGPLPKHLKLLADWAGQAPDLDNERIAQKDCKDASGLRFCSWPLVFAVGGKTVKALWVVASKPLAAGEVQGETAEDPGWRGRSMSLPPAAFKPLSGRKVVWDGPVFDRQQMAAKIGGWMSEAQGGKKGKRPWRLGSEIGAYGKPPSPYRGKGLAGQLDWLESSSEPPGLALALAESKAACFVASSNGIAVEDPRLADYQLYRGLDAASCMQEVSMFVMNWANPEKKIEQVADKYKIAERGFDELSFRKQPTKRADPKIPKRPHPG